MRNESLPDTKLVCQQHDPDIWMNEATEAEAVRLCLHGNNGQPCPALAACLDLGTDPNQPFTKHGVWGGMNDHKRDKIRARRNRTGDDRYRSVTLPAPNCRTHVAGF